MSKSRLLRVGIAVFLVVMAAAPQAYAQERVVVPQTTLRAAAANPSLFDTSAGQSTLAQKFRPRRPSSLSCRQKLLLGAGIGAGVGGAFGIIAATSGIEEPVKMAVGITAISSLIGLAISSRTCR